MVAGFSTIGAHVYIPQFTSVSASAVQSVNEVIELLTYRFLEGLRILFYLFHTIYIKRVRVRGGGCSRGGR